MKGHLLGSLHDAAGERRPHLGRTVRSREINFGFICTEMVVVVMKCVPGRNRGRKE